MTDLHTRYFIETMEANQALVEIIGHKVHHEMMPYPKDGSRWWDHWWCICGWDAVGDAAIDDSKMQSWHDEHY